MRKLKLISSIMLCLGLVFGVVSPTNNLMDAACEVCKVTNAKTKGVLIGTEPYYTPTLKNDPRTKKCVIMGTYKNGKKVYKRCYKYVPLCKLGTYDKLSLASKGQTTTFMFRAFNDKPKKKKVSYTTYIPWNLCIKNAGNPNTSKKINVQLQRVVGKQWKTVSHTVIDTKKLGKSPMVFSKEYGGKNLLMGVNYRFLIKLEGQDSIVFTIGVGKAHPSDTPSLVF